jgi:chaperone modulatory protein CbpM
MIRRADKVAAELGVRVDELMVWVERRWVRPIRSDQTLQFDDIDVARLRMIIDFHHDLAIDDEAMPVVLDLIDRLHASHVQLRNLLRAVANLPEAAQNAVIEQITGNTGQ